MQELAVVGPRHVLSIHRPVRHLVVVIQYLTVVGWVSNAWTRPVLGIYEVSTLKSLLLVIFYLRSLGKLRVELVALRMSNHEVNIRSSEHPFSE